MTYETELADRIRRTLREHPEITERKMFGGLAFLLAGHMAAVASGRGGLMVRVDPDRGQASIDAGAAEPAVMRGRPMRGWLRIATADVATEAELAHWVEMSIAFVRTLPPKESPPRA